MGVAERPGRELLDLGVEAGADGAGLVPRYPLDAHGRGHPLHLPVAGVRGVHLGHGSHDGPVDALVAFERVLGEEAAGAKLRHPERQRANARREHALPVGVPAVARGLAELADLGAHDLVGHGLRQLPEELLQVDGVVREAEHPRCGHCLSLEPVLSRFQILGNGRFHKRLARPLLTPTFPTRFSPHAQVYYSSVRLPNLRRPFKLFPNERQYGL